MDKVIVSKRETKLVIININNSTIFIHNKKIMRSSKCIMLISPNRLISKFVHSQIATKELKIPYIITTSNNNNLNHLSYKIENILRIINGIIRLVHLLL